MSTTLTTGVKVTRGGVGAEATGPGGPLDPGSGGGGDDWPPGLTREDALEPNKYRIGIWVALAGILMLFVALTSALVVRQSPALNGGQLDWVVIQIPAVLWINTVVLVISSVTMELARRALARNDYGSLKRWIVATTLLGAFFLAGQVIAWEQLAAQGIYVNSHPHSSFFYLLTSLHALHLLGGVIALCYVTVNALRMRIGIAQRTAVGVTATYWHFMDGLWVYLFVLLFFWK
ncbi:MAG TPA: cytochrome c oxidase subunit 3 [Blastocatellia bacterium]|nr:cytochrome c oxidase subunit 3 [Blastocatellia bacterium]